MTDEEFNEKFLSYYFDYLNKINVILIIMKYLENILIPRTGSSSMDSWVLITGASEGIGKTFAEEFSKLGFNILIVLRDIHKLNKCKVSIKQVSKTSKIEWISFDFSKIELKQYQKYFIEIFSKYDISILINNVGVREVQNFNEFTLDQVYNMSVINVVPQVVLTRMLIDKFLERKNRSAIINMSSSSSVYPLPNFVLYSATKVLNDYFSRGISYELQNKVDILSAKPFFVKSSTNNLTNNGLTVTSTQQFVNSILDQL